MRSYESFDQTLCFCEKPATQITQVVMEGVTPTFPIVVKVYARCDDHKTSIRATVDSVTPST